MRAANCEIFKNTIIIPDLTSDQIHQLATNSSKSWIVVIRDDIPNRFDWYKMKNCGTISNWGSSFSIGDLEGYRNKPLYFVSETRFIISDEEWFLGEDGFWYPEEERTLVKRKSKNKDAEIRMKFIGKYIRNLAKRLGGREVMLNTHLIKEATDPRISSCVGEIPWKN